MSVFEVLEYVTADGKKPFGEWLLKLKDEKAQVKIHSRVTRASLGNFGDWKKLENANGICEMREHYGSGFRIFYKKTGNKIILLLAGSTKKDQQNAIDKAKQYLLDYEKRTKL
mgnify:CR=1 FL=1